MNKVKVYRVEHMEELYPKEWIPSEVNFGVGPYTYTNYPSYFKKNIEETKRLSDLLLRNEPSKINPKKSRLARIGLFATFIDRRPGPKEDPGIRDKIKIEKLLLQNLHMYGFDSLEQLNHWFNDDEEREELDRHGFGISIYYAVQPLIGLRQAMFRRDKTIKLVNKKRLIVG